MSRSRRPRGGQIGNRNGLKHSLPRPVGGFYSRSTPAPEEEDFLPPEAFADELERSIAITRKTIRSILEKDPGNDRLLSYNVSLLDRLIRTHELISARRADRHRHSVDDLGRRLSITQDASLVSHKQPYNEPVCRG